MNKKTYFYFFTTLLIFTIFSTGCWFAPDSTTNASEYDNNEILEEDVWTDGNISKDGQIKKYYITVAKGTRYFIYMNNAWDGDRMKTAKTGLKIAYSDGTSINDNYGNITNCYSVPFTFVALTTDTITVTAASKNGWDWEEGTGTYGIKYTSRPEYDELSEGKWKDDKIIAKGQTNKYHIKVAKETRYFIYMNNALDGDGTKTTKTGLKIAYSDGTSINDNYGNITKHYSVPFTFIAQNTDTITVTTASGDGGWENGTGTYGIKYTSRPEYDTLSEGEWKDDKIIVNEQTNKYYINVSAGKQYSIYLNDKSDGDGTKTANKIGLKIIYSQDSDSDNPVICNNYDNANKLYTKPYTFTAPSEGTIIITAASLGGWNWEDGTSTYAIKYVENK